MRKLLGYLVVAFLIVAALLFVVANYSSDTAIYECSGVVTTAESAPITLFARITQYRWWAFWAPLDGLLRLELQSTTGNIPTIPDDPLAARWFKTGPNSSKPAPFPGLIFGPSSSPNERENLFGIERVESYLVLYRWPNAGETVDLTEAGQGQFSTISSPPESSSPD
jgi:hypothetical protein